MWSLPRTAPIITVLVAPAHRTLVLPAALSSGAISVRVSYLHHVVFFVAPPRRLEAAQQWSVRPSSVSPSSQHLSMSHSRRPRRHDGEADARQTEYDSYKYLWYTGTASRGPRPLRNPGSLTGPECERDFSLSAVGASEARVCFKSHRRKGSTRRWSGMYNQPWEHQRRRACASLYLAPRQEVVCMGVRA